MGPYRRPPRAVECAGGWRQADEDAGGRRPLHSRRRLRLHGHRARGGHPVRRRSRADPAAAPGPHADRSHLRHAVRPARRRRMRPPHHRRVGRQCQRRPRPQLSPRGGEGRARGHRGRGPLEPHAGLRPSGRRARRALPARAIAARHRTRRVEPDVQGGHRSVVGRTAAARARARARRRRAARAARRRGRARPLLGHARRDAPGGAGGAPGHHRGRGDPPAEPDPVGSRASS